MKQALHSQSEIPLTPPTQAELRAFADRLYEENTVRGVETLRKRTREEIFSVISALNPARILEIGTAEGASGIGMLSAAPNATLTTVELCEERFLAAKNNFRAAGIASRVTQLFGDAREALLMMERPFDFILLDGPKGMYAEFYPILKNLLTPGGVLAADDVLFHGYITGETPYRTKHGAIIRSLRTFIETAQTDTDMTCRFFEEEDGLILLTKNND